MDDRSYMVETPDGGVYRRNRYHLKRTKGASDIQLNPDTPPMMIPVPRPAQVDITKTTNTPQTPTTSKIPTTQPQQIRKPPERLKDFVQV